MNDLYKIPLESTRRAQEEKIKADLAAQEAERKEKMAKAMIIPKTYSYSTREWSKIKTRRKIAAKSRSRNR